MQETDAMRNDGCSQENHDGHGLRIRVTGFPDAMAAATQVLTRLGAIDLLPLVRAAIAVNASGDWLHLCMDDAKAQDWAPGFDTLQLAATLQLDSHNKAEDLTREIVVAMLVGPIAFEFPSMDECESAVRIRRNIVQAARKTTLAFHTSEAERPEDCWAYDEDCGFVIRPGVSIITALARATQPEVSGTLYTFSCYRATEYVIVLGIAQELAQCNPALLQELQALWTTRPIKSGEFHDVFLREQGSMERPLPPHYFVPGDRAWFRNPDEASADASGFEGSWVMYLGDGLFSNFWKRDQPYTLQDKCVELYHWRHGLYRDEDGEERIDEGKVAELVEATRHDPAELARILAVMARYREARGVYTDAGGCIDTTREFPRWVRPTTSDLVLPAL
jgi:hypothetical protein